MSDSGRTLSRPEDGLSYAEIKWELAKLEIVNEELRRENEQLRQQVRDLTAHPLAKHGPVEICFSCGSPVIGRMLDHKCKA